MELAEAKETTVDFGEAKEATVDFADAKEATVEFAEAKEATVDFSNQHLTSFKNSKIMINDNFKFLVTQYRIQRHDTWATGHQQSR